MTNCPNCGAPIDPNADKCSYCDTSYFDISCIPIGEPFCLRLNVGTRKNPKIITEMVYTAGVDIGRNPNYVDGVDIGGRCFSYITGCLSEYTLTFVSI